MLELEGLNYWAVLVASFITIVLGAFWYSPLGFGKRWSKLTGVDIMKLPQSEANKAIGSVAVGAIVQAFLLGIVVNSLGTETVKDGALLGLILWLGFVAAATVGDALYSRRGWKFWWLNGSFYLIVLVVNTVLFAVWS
jgi:hypothetical protein